MCGRCVIHCPAKAKHVRDDLARTKQLFSLKPRVIASLAPSFASEFPDYTKDQLIYALKQLGFWGVSETAIGADLFCSICKGSQGLLKIKTDKNCLYRARVLHVLNLLSIL